jgi:hypothetical protein
MWRQDVCILLNSTPKYYFMLELQIVMLRRYATSIHWPVYLATEFPEHEICVKLARDYDVEILPLKMEDAGFLESRAAALRILPSTIKYVLPLQEDFLLDRQPMMNELLEALNFMDSDKKISSIRLMPCPGPIESDVLYVPRKPWAILTEDDTYHFTYQATFWRREDLLAYFVGLLEMIDGSDEEKRTAALKMNIAEIYVGKELLKKILPSSIHLAYKRLGKWSNAIYLCPWPYRPTAIVRGKVEPFAEELFKREGVPYSKPTSSLL